uniref:Guanylate cyclase domain-containing protein n=1 Tax=Steinernema glaseri TaxID=37863 RepID=A0A1I7YJ98_9BILA
MRMGIRVEPRAYACATVLFCQICHFQIFLASCTPEQVIHFLNNVFTLFDREIEGKDAYKVETTGETYMVASGVPNENENRHVFIIADIALRLRD